VTLYERFERVSEVDMTSSTRGRLLARAGKACLGMAVAVAGLSRVEQAMAGTGHGCCSLAYNVQCPNCTGHGYDCGSACTRWAWYCVDPTHRVWICGECYAAGSCPGCSCGHVAITRDNKFPITPGPGE
jgi:hypothetical protein